MIFDNDWQDAACKVAAGVINPITGKRLVKSWRSDIAMPFAKKYYENLQKDFGASFYQERKILQLCKSKEEVELWESRKKEAEYADFLSQYFAPKTFAELNDNFGSFIINHSAWVEAPAAMDAFRKYFLEKNILRLENFDHKAIKIEKDFFEYKILKAKKIIFCEGWKAIENPYFSWLPYRPAKGEILNLVADKDLGEHIVHREKWLMKFRNSTYRVGSSWDRENFRNGQPTESAKAEIFNALPSIAGQNVNWKILSAEAGVRPCTATTKPHLGEHPKIKNLHSFNGFGSKGYALSPYFAEHFADYLDGKISLDKESDLARHIKKFFIL